MGRKVKPTLAATPQVKIIHTLLLAVNISSIEPATTIVGIDDTRPEKKRPMITPEMFGIVPIIIQNPLYKNIDTMYNGLRSKVSEMIAATVTFCHSILTLFISETRPFQILKKRLAGLNQATTSKEPFTIDNPDATLSTQDFVTTSLTRPTRLFFTEPIVFLVTIMGSIAYSQIYLLTPGDLLTLLHPTAIGFFLDVLPRFYDHFLLKRIKARRGIIKPEDKIRGFAIGAPLLAIGLWWFAWTIPPEVDAPWPLSFAPLILIGFATNEFDATLSGYLTDSYTIFSASAFSSLAFLRAVLSGSIPLFMNQMYNGLGANEATSILAAVATVFCVAPVLFLRYGESLREKSVFARYSWEAEKTMGSMSKAVVRQGCLNSSDGALVGEDDIERVAEELTERGEVQGEVPG